MAAIGPGRPQIQILNRVDVIGGGHWEVLEDATHDQHTISPYALSVILWDLTACRDIPSVS